MASIGSSVVDFEVRVKICCVQSQSEASYCTAVGVSMLGLVTEMPGPGVATDETIREVASAIAPGVESVLLTALQDPDSVIAQQRELRTTALQLMVRHSSHDLQRLRQELPGIRLMQVINVTDQTAVARAVEAAPLVDALVLDSANPSLGELGATGRTHDWSISREIRDQVDVPVLLAGGLHASNVAAAVEAVRPYAVDVCTGVRDPKYRLDVSKVRSFMAVIRSLKTQQPGASATLG